jgi:hypothetical protein
MNIYYIVDPVKTTTNGVSFKDAVKNFIKINHQLNINSLILTDRARYMKANFNFYKQYNKNKVSISLQPTIWDEENGIPIENWPLRPMIYFDSNKQYNPSTFITMNNQSETPNKDTDDKSKGESNIFKFGSDPEQEEKKEKNINTDLIGVGLMSPYANPMMPFANSPMMPVVNSPMMPFVNSPMMPVVNPMMPVVNSPRPLRRSYLDSVTSSMTSQLGSPLGSPFENMPYVNPLENRLLGPLIGFNT